MIADMRRRVTIQEPVLTPDGAGGFTGSWQNIATAPVVYAAITPVAAGEQFRAGQLETTATHHIVIRYRSDLTPNMRLIDEAATVYTIISLAAQLGLQVYLELLTAVRSS